MQSISDSDISKNDKMTCYNKCLKCFRPLSSCYCKYIKPVETNCKFIFLMHPKEAYHQKTGTGRLAHLTLQDSEIFVGLDFSHSNHFQELINSPEYYPVLLYPGENAWTANQIEFKNNILNKKLLVILIDSTWFFAKKIIRLNPFLLNLPQLSFNNGYRSEFRFKTQPALECLSTIESCYYLINELKSAKIISECDPQPLMDIFRKMVNFQLQAEEERILRGEAPRNKKGHKHDKIVKTTKYGTAEIVKTSIKM